MRSKFLLYRWSSYNYNFFYNNLNYLYLGAKQDKRFPATDTYSHMYSHFRGEYSIFFYKRMWLNYIKKINLLKKLYGDPANNFFFITNKAEQVKFLAGQASKSYARPLFIESAGQFSNNFFEKESKSFFFKTSALGTNLPSPLYDYSDRHSNIFFSLSNAPQDWGYFKFLTEISDIDFLTFSTADSDSVFLSKMIPLFGNNDSAKSWFFFFSLFRKSAVRLDALNPNLRSNFIRGSNLFINRNFYKPFWYKPKSTLHSFYVCTKRFSTRSLRSFCIVNLKKASYPAAYSFGADRFTLPRGMFHYFKYKT